MSKEEYAKEKQFLDRYWALCEEFGMRISIYDEDSLFVGNYPPEEGDYLEYVRTSEELDEIEEKRQEAQKLRDKREREERIEECRKRGIEYNENGYALNPPKPYSYTIIDWQENSGWVPYNPHNNK